MRAQGTLRISQLNELLNSFLSGLRELNLMPVRAVLYGSYAKGKPRRDGHSDVDLAVWLEKELEGFWTDNPGLLRLSSQHHPISPRFYVAGETPADDPFIGEILKTGQELSLSNPQYAT